MKFFISLLVFTCLFLTGCATTYMADPPLVLDTEHIRIPPYLEAFCDTDAWIMWESKEHMYGWLEVYGPKGFHRLIRTDEPGTLHRVAITNLPPGQRFTYRVAGTLMPFATFLTPCSDLTSFRFGVLGDNRTHPHVFAEVAKSLAHQHCDFVVHSGDLMGDGRNLHEWYNEWFTPATPLLRQSPVFIAWGNHEFPRSEDSYLHRFYPTRSPRLNRGFFSFRYGPVSFFIINPYEPYHPGSPQYQWLTEELAATDAPFTIASLHVSPLTGSNHARSGDVRELRRHLLPLFIRHNLSMLLTGHDHLYERNHLHGMTHLITGGAGAPLRAPYIYLNPYSHFASSIYHYVVCDVEDTHIDARVYTPENDRIDAVTVFPRVPATTPVPAVATFHTPTYDYLDTDTFSWDIFLRNFTTTFITGTVEVDAPQEWHVDPGHTISFFLQRDEPQRTLHMRAWPDTPEPGVYPIETRVLLPGITNTFSYDLTVFDHEAIRARWECSTPVTAPLATNIVRVSLSDGIWSATLQQETHPRIFSPWPAHICNQATSRDVALHRIRFSGAQERSYMRIRWYITDENGRRHRVERGFHVPVNNQWYTYTFYLGRESLWRGTIDGYVIIPHTDEDSIIDIDYIRLITDTGTE